MDNAQLLQLVNLIFRKELNNPSIILTPDSTANDISEWNSLSHIELIFAIENYFKIKFKSSEILAWRTVGQMVESINTKLK
jgi:acyl carrier protein